jgi:2-keto-4-pentenoate hydratase/2-oxohepta-3-ene-1,7-dioic acid hydratase in catechol pathway
MTFRLATISDRAALVDEVGQWYDLARLTDGLLGPDPMAAVGAADALHELSAGLGTASPDGDLDAARAAGIVGAPVPRPRNVFAVGLNYRSHAEESGMVPPATPLVFTKFPSCIVGPDAAIPLAAASADYEVELVVVIGRGGRDIAEAEAWSHVAGLTVGQDVSDRTLQFAASPPHFDLGKSRDGYGPMGPVLVSVDSVGDPDDLALRCEIDGEIRQEDRTSNLIFGVPTLISYLSGILTLAPGDVIFTGTPAGVGASDGRFLLPGQVVTSTIEGIGSLVNACTP